MPELRCVSDQDLQAYVLGKLPKRIGRSVALHLESCAVCDARAQRLDGAADPLVDCLRQALAPATVQGVVTPASGPAPAAAAGLPPARIGAYRVLEEIGRGGMAVVYKAREDNPERIVALKVLLTGCHSGGERRARFRTEADTIARLRHGHIVQVFEAGEHDGLPFLALEFCDGGSLAQRLGGVPQAPAAAAALVEPLAQALEHAHQAGVIHRDLKPANVLLTADGQPKVSDFGLAKAERPELTATGAVLGTPSYMAPEQAAGSRTVGPAADVYALGAILYELLTGRPPFQGATALETMEQVRHQEPVPPRRLQPKVPRDLETICLKCLEKEPARRYANAGALADDLARFREGRPVQARPVGAAGRTTRWARRNPGWAATAAAIAALLMLVATSTSLLIWHLNDALQQSEDERVRASAAELTGNHRLWASYLAQAQAHRFSGRQGQRFNSLAAIRKATALALPPGHTLAELRNEAIACLVLADVQTALDRAAIVDPSDESCLVPDAAHTRYATIGNDRAIHIRQWPDGHEIARLENSGSVEAPQIAFSPDGRFLLHRYGHARDTRMKVWRLDVREPAVVFEHETKGFDFQAVFRGDSGQVAIGHEDGSVVLYATATGAVDQRLRPGFVAQLLAFCPGSRRLAAASPDAKSVAVLDTDNGRVVANLPHPEPVTSIGWHPDGRVLAAGCTDHKIYLWDVAREQTAMPPLEGHSGYISTVGFNHAGDRLASHDWDHSLRLWDARTGRPLVATTCTRLMSFSPDDQFLLGNTVQNQARLLRIANARELRLQAVSKQSLQRCFYSGIANPDGRLLLAHVGSAIVFIDWAHGTEVAELALASSAAFAFTRDDALLTSGIDRALERWPMRTDPATGIVHIGPPETMHPSSTKDLAGWQRRRHGRGHSGAEPRAGAARPRSAIDAQAVRGCARVCG